MKTRGNAWDQGMPGVQTFTTRHARKHSGRAHKHAISIENTYDVGAPTSARREVTRIAGLDVPHPTSKAKFGNWGGGIFYTLGFNVACESYLLLL